MFNVIVGLVDRLFACAGALILSQMPLFMQNYQQQLAGRTAEVSRQVALMSQAAGQAGKSVPEYIQKFLTSQDADFSRQGAIMQALIERSKVLNEAFVSLEQADLWSKPFVFIAHVQKDIVYATWDSFVYGLPMNAEGFAYAACGLCLGFFLFFLLKQLVKGLFSSVVRKKIRET